ncbi:MAG: hypothetical protein COV72_02290 [Candidatus Omnitrophica bacterium CG11_big_fil_rev_8_21_14_0_20_42_13]|uniref:Response regulatory domain-containing protein n=1 Tax=Candidatus Ghiorseimicrobium undicola TaxID=1974746 RepID=A0A2H0LYX3_9BACT|nr:MAG: hypothetical protein COV72_02290 [Candidatus Omnitrophica bacterium CG11_big_fil_rev_8_21_14_0_20_42_13]
MAEKLKMLLVDDEENILNALCRVFRGDDSYEIITANNAHDALNKASTMPVDIIISDQRMPGMGGAELLQKIRDMYPDSIRFLLSGYADVEAIISAINEGDIYRFVKKPWNNEELKGLVKNSISQRDITRIISEAIFRARRTVDLNRDIDVAVSDDGRNINVRLKETSKVIPAHNVLRLIDFVIGSIESEGKLDAKGIKFSSGVVNKKEGKINLAIELGKGINLTIELPST